MPGSTNQGLNYKNRDESYRGFWTSRQPDPSIVQPNMGIQQKQTQAAHTKKGIHKVHLQRTTLEMLGFEDFFSFSFSLLLL